MISDLTFLPAAVMAAQIREKQISPVDLVEAHLAKIERLNPKLNAFVHVDAGWVRREARHAAAAVIDGKVLGPLHGVPLSIKSSIEVEGLRCEAGSRLRTGFVGAQDAPLVARLRNAGAIILGATNTPELLMAWETDNLLYGRTKSPWGLDRTPGGSSGGEAAAIAAGISAGGVGSDGGGSIRVPAHFSGICGLKPTPGRIPSTGHFPPSGGPFALIGVVGPMARTVADLKLLFEVMQGPDDGDPCAAPVSLGWPSDRRSQASPSRLFRRRRPHPGYARNSTGSANRRRSSKPRRISGRTISSGRSRGGARTLEEVFRRSWRNARRHNVSRTRARPEPDLLDSFWNGPPPSRSWTGDSLLDAWIRRDALHASFLQQMREYPILLCPAAAIPAFRHGERSWQIDGKTVNYLDAWSYTEWFNLLGNPAAVVPVSHTSEGLPIGVQIVGRPWQEEQVLSVAAVVEKECDAWRIPPIR